MKTYKMKCRININNFFVLLVVLNSCKGQTDLISTTTYKIQSADNAYLKVKVFNNANCKLSCKQKLTYVAINDNNFIVEADFQKKFQFAKRDSLVSQKLSLNSGDSLVIACGCAGKVSPGSEDWNMNLTILSASAPGHKLP